jgi:hypothetical protein
MVWIGSPQIADFIICYLTVFDILSSCVDWGVDDCSVLRAQARRCVIAAEPC